MKSQRFECLFVAAAVATLVLVQPVRADAPVACRALEISATAGDTEKMDPQLQPLERKLKKPPFSAWNVFRMLSRAPLTLQPLRAESIKLAIGRAEIMLREVSDVAGKKQRLVLHLTVDDDKGKRVTDTKVSVDAGDFVIIGRALPNQEGHLIAIACQ